MRRVVVTGMGGVTALGNSWPTIRENLRAGRTAIKRMQEWERYQTVNTRLAAPVVDFSVDDRYPRKKMRTMGPVARMAVFATEQALQAARLVDDPVVRSGRCGIAYGSSFGSPQPVLAFTDLMTTGSSKGLNATTYIQMMSHTAAVNIGLFFGVTGRIITTSSACTSGSQAIGYSVEAIRWNKADLMIAGGAEELDITMSAVFDTLYATSVKNDTPDKTPRPFDRERDGLVIGEGAVTLVLEELEHAKARGATIHAEIVGFATNSDGNHVTQPKAETMEVALRQALADADLPADAIDYVNGHGTATEWGDIAESQATARVFGSATPFHSLKGHFGHTLGACGALEAWLGIEMVRDGWLCPTANLQNLDPRCAELDYVQGDVRGLSAEYFASNNFAFGGINTSLVFRRR
jgi:3-oxoacyl-[acyl-carrier-protein] synthase II